TRARETFESGEFKHGPRFQIFLGKEDEAARWGSTELLMNIYSSPHDSQIRESAFKHEALLLALVKILDGLKSTLQKWLRRQRNLRLKHFTPPDVPLPDEDMEAGFFHRAASDATRSSTSTNSYLHNDNNKNWAGFHGSAAMRGLPRIYEVNAFRDWDEEVQDEPLGPTPTENDPLPRRPKNLADFDTTPASHATRDGMHREWLKWVSKSEERIELEAAWRRREGMVLSFVRGFEYIVDSY
ncbi:unnamed protein product, partial [Amoebophrya sp. A25]